MVAQKRGQPHRLTNRCAAVTLTSRSPSLVRPPALTVICVTVARVAPRDAVTPTGGSVLLRLTGCLDRDLRHSRSGERCGTPARAVHRWRATWRQGGASVRPMPPPLRSSGSARAVDKCSPRGRARSTPRESRSGWSTARRLPRSTSAGSTPRRRPSATPARLRPAARFVGHRTTE